MPDDVKTSIVRIKSDEASIKRTQDDVKAVAADMRSLGTAAQGAKRQMGPAETELVQFGKGAQTVGRHIDLLNDKLAKSKRTLSDNRKELDANTIAEKAYAAQVAKAQRESRDRAGLYGDVESRTRALTGAIGYAGGETGAKIERTANIGAEMLASVEAIKLLKLEVPELVRGLNLSAEGLVVTAAAAVGLAAATLIAKDFFDTVIDGATQLKTAVIGQTAGLEEFYEFAQTATTAEARKRIDELLEERSVNEEYLASLREIKTVIEEGIDPGSAIGLERLSKNAIRVGDALGLLDIGLDDAKNSIAEAEAKTKSIDTQFALLTQGYVDNAFAMNDAKAAAEAQAIAERDLAQARGAQLLTETQLQIKAANMSAEQIEKRLEQIAIEKQYYGALVTDLKMLAEQNDGYADSLAKAETYLQQLSSEQTILNGHTYTLAKSQEILGNWFGIASDGADILTDGVQGLTNTVDNASKTLDEYRAKQAEVDAERALDATREQADFTRQRTRDLAAHYADMAELDRDYYADQAGIISDMQADVGKVEQERLDEIGAINKDLQDLAKEHAKSMRRIQRDSMRDEQQAARNLDAVALADAQKRKQDAIEDENDQYKDARDKRQEQYDESIALLDKERDETLSAGQQSLRDLEAKHRQERDETERAFRQELAIADQERFIKLQRQQEDYQIEDTARAAHYGVVEGSAQAHYANLLGITSAGMAAIEQEAARRLSVPYRATANSPAIQGASANVKSALSTAANTYQAAASAYVSPLASSSNSLYLSEGAIQIISPETQRATYASKQIAEQIRSELSRMIERN
jgi:hypothetical protein